MARSVIVPIKIAADGRAFIEETDDTRRAVQRMRRETERATRDSARDFDRLGLSIRGVADIAKGFIASFVGFQGFNFLADSIRTAGEFETSLLRLDSQLETTGRTAEATAEDIREIARALDATTLGDQLEIEAAAAQLASFSNVATESFEQVLSLGLDMQEVLGTGLVGSATQLGKALNDPIKGLTALSRVGVQFTDEQRELIKTLVDTGNAAEAQRIILAELESQYGGTSEAAAQGFEGAVDSMNMALADFRNAFGSAFQGQAETAIRGFTSVVASAAENMDTLVKVTTAAAVAIGTRLLAPAVISGVAALARGITSASAAMAAFNVVVGANPLVRFVSILATVGAALFAFREDIIETARTWRWFQNLTGAVSNIFTDSIEKQKAAIDATKRSLDSATKSARNWQELSKTSAFGAERWEIAEERVASLNLQLGNQVMRLRELEEQSRETGQALDEPANEMQEYSTVVAAADVEQQNFVSSANAAAVAINTFTHNAEDATAHVDAYRNSIAGLSTEYVSGIQSNQAFLDSLRSDTQNVTDDIRFNFQGLFDGLIGNLITGTQDAGDVITSWFNQLTGNLARQATNTLGGAFQGLFQGQGFSLPSGTTGQGLAFNAGIGGVVGGVLGEGNIGSTLGGSLGGAAGGALASAALAASGAAVGAIAGSVIPVIGTIAGAALGSALGGLFGGDEPDRFPFGVVQAGRGSFVGFDESNVVREGAVGLSGLQLEAVGKHGGEAFAQELQGVLLQLDEALLQLAPGTDLADASFGSFGRFRGGIVGVPGSDGSPETVDDAVQHFVRSWVEASEVVSDEVKLIFDQLEGSAQELVEAFGGLQGIQDYIDGGSLQSLVDELLQAEPTLYSAANAAAELVNELISVTDATNANDIAALGLAVSERYQLELALVTEITNMIRTANDIAADTVRSFELDIASQEERYNLFRQEAERFRDIALTAEDPAEIFQAYQRAIEAERAAWQELSLEQRRAEIGVFTEFTNALTAGVEQRLGGTIDEIEVQRTGIQAALTEALAQPAATMQNAANQMINAAGSIQQAATAIQNQTIEVELVGAGGITN